MYVEFVGVPGAGKTTIVEEVRVLLGISGIDCITRADFFDTKQKRARKALWSFLHFRYLDIYGLILWLRLSWRRSMDVIKTGTRIHEYQKLRFELAKKRHEVAVWDNGFVQWFSNHVYSGVLSKKAATDFIADKLPRNTLLVFVDTSANESVRRMQEREAQLRAEVGWKLSETEERERIEAYAESWRVQKELVDALGKQGFVSITLDGTKPPAENASIVYERIKKQL